MYLIQAICNPFLYDSISLEKIPMNLLPVCNVMFVPKVFNNIFRFLIRLMAHPLIQFALQWINDVNNSTQIREIRVKGLLSQEFCWYITPLLCVSNNQIVSTVYNLMRIQNLFFMCLVNRSTSIFWIVGLVLLFLCHQYRFEISSSTE
uniref:ORF49 n=1 Tax=Malaco herpesvirus 1 TaxID=3031797 RepID=A0AA48SF08_9VIRU|nr:TPA_asm: ORF49 [Malaco herpesvirus 1]